MSFALRDGNYDTAKCYGGKDMIELRILSYVRNIIKNPNIHIDKEMKDYVFTNFYVNNWTMNGGRYGRHEVVPERTELIYLGTNNTADSLNKDNYQVYYYVPSELLGYYLRDCHIPDKTIISILEKRIFVLQQRNLQIQQELNELNQQDDFKSRSIKVCNGKIERNNWEIGINNSIISELRLLNYEQETMTHASRK